MFKVKEKSIGEVVQLAAYKAIRKERSKVSVFLPPQYIPPIPPYKSVHVETEQYGQVRLFCKPASTGGWIIEVKFKGLVFNPPITQEEGKKLLEKLQGK